MAQKEVGTQRNQQLSDEELQRTQVLNLKDFKETARIEKLSSKKPSIILALIGLLFISVGNAVPTVQSISARNQAEKSREQIERREQIEETQMVCHWERLNNPNQTDEIVDATFTFKGDKLTNVKKDYKLIKSAGVTQDPPELASYLTALQAFLMQTTGYKVSVQTIDGGSITTTEVDFTTVDMTKIPESHQQNYRFSITNKLDMSKNDVQTNMTSQGYTCK